MFGQSFRVGVARRWGTWFIVRNANVCRIRLIALFALAPLVAGCAGNNIGSLEQFGSDLFSKDAQWFQRSNRLFIRSVSIDAPPLTPERAVTTEDLVGADGACPGSVPPANALADGAAAAPAPTGGTVALLHTECDVVRGIGMPDSVNISNGPRGNRLAVVTYLRGPRAGIYTFSAGRLTSVEAAPEQPAQPKAAKPKPKKKQA